MTEVSFNEEPHYARRASAVAADQGSIIGLMYKLGLASTEKDANVVMGGIIAVCLIVSATMFVFVQPHEKTNEELRQEALQYQQSHGMLSNP